MDRYADRRSAGQALARELELYAGRHDVVVLALPRGGVPVAYEVALRLEAPLDVLVAGKLSTPGGDDLAMGALAAGGAPELSPDVIERLGVSAHEVADAIAAQAAEIARREQAYRGGRPPLEVGGRICIVVDDGLASGATMRAAVAALRRRGPRRVVIAVPVASAETCVGLSSIADHVVCAATRAADRLYSVGHWYRDFSQTTDEEVRMLLLLAEHARHNGHGALHA